MPEDKIQVKVENGLVTLAGEVKWNVQKLAAETSIAYISGIRAIIIILCHSILQKRQV